MLVDPAALDPAGDRALLLFSGGLDSTLVALLLRERAIPTTALTFAYPNRPRRERAAADRAAAALGFGERVEMPFALGDFRNHRPAWLEHAAAGWIPYRNLIFLAVAAHVALLHGCNLIAAGIRVRDSDVFTDARASHLALIEGLLADSGIPRAARPPRLFLPLIEDDAILARLLKTGARATIEASWTCWHDGDEPCGVCGPCVDRTRRLAAASGS